MTANAAEMKAHRLVAARTTAQLLNDWDMTEAAPMTEELPIVRGWIMDELRARDAEAYDAWMDDEDIDASPRIYFKTTAA